jgi:hypothetical protein
VGHSLLRRGWACCSETASPAHLAEVGRDAVEGNCEGVDGEVAASEVLLQVASERSDVDGAVGQWQAQEREMPAELDYVGTQRAGQGGGPRLGSETSEIELEHRTPEERIPDGAANEIGGGKVWTRAGQRSENANGVNNRGARCRDAHSTKMTADSIGSQRRQGARLARGVRSGVLPEVPVRAVGARACRCGARTPDRDHPRR